MSAKQTIIIPANTMQHPNIDKAFGLSLNSIHPKVIAVNVLPPAQDTVITLKGYFRILIGYKAKANPSRAYPVIKILICSVRSPFFNRIIPVLLNKITKGRDSIRHI